MMKKNRRLARGVAIVGAGMSKFGMFKDKDSKDLFAEAFNGMMASVDKGMDPNEIEALYLGNFSNDFFMHQSHWGPIISDLIGLTPKPATRTEGACASSALAFREGVFAIASGFYDLVLVGGVEHFLGDRRGLLDDLVDRDDRVDAAGTVTAYAFLL